MKNSNKQESQTASRNSPSPKPANSASYELTPSEIASMRQEFRESGKLIREQLGLPDNLTV